MINKKKIFNATNYEKQKIYVAKANSVTEIQFDMDKNYYRFTNTGALPVYVSTSYTPTTQRYDVKVDGNTVSSFNEPTDRDTIYVLNNNNEDITILITSFLDEFDPNFSAMGDMAIEVKGTVQTDGIVKDFECSLPEGHNNIGRVSLSFTDTDKLDKLVNRQTDIRTTINNLFTKVEEIESKMGSKPIAHYSNMVIGSTSNGDFILEKELPISWSKIKCIVFNPPKNLELSKFVILDGNTRIMKLNVETGTRIIIDFDLRSLNQPILSVEGKNTIETQSLISCVIEYEE